MNKSESPTLRELREQNKRSREEVAAALGVTANALTNYECGIRRISLEQILILAILYGISTEEVIEAQLNSCHSGLKDSRRLHQTSHTV
ncbi:MAG: helix-turn-helix domain-containing protein [Christensenellaceae bacterium]|jgi:DNA-binding helix-turn-helix protein|nr:MAG: hypothetical protein DBY05_03595 [Clostridiales bacterium]PWM02062.1 MAG: hypothetical protein DBY05_03195 [Clostridiales bacterium]